MRPIRVFIVDDSAVVRQVLSDLLKADPEIELVGAAADPLWADAKLAERDWPDVIVLDVEMPRMDGITYLRRLMKERPTPVVICSTLTGKGAATTLDALEAGAVSIITKPQLGLRQFLQESAAELIAAIKAAAQVNMSRMGVVVRDAQQVRNRRVIDARPPVDRPAVVMPMSETTERIVAIGTSTGGTQALEAVLAALPRASPGIAIVQHMPEKFTAAFADRLDRICEITVREAVGGERLLPGHALVAPGGRHLTLRRSGAYFYAEVNDGPRVNRHKPSVDVLFRSVAGCAGQSALGILMTGMGDDGARGLRQVRDAGGASIAQDEATSVVFGMPREAIRLGAAERVLPLGAMARAIVGWGAGRRDVPVAGT